jgi:hypothetical protein
MTELSPGVDRLDFVLGEWIVESVSLNEPAQWLTGRPTIGTAHVLVGGAGLDWLSSADYGDEVFDLSVVFGYDRSLDTYRAAFFDNRTGSLDMYEGGFDQDRLVLSSRSTTTGPPAADEASFMTRNVVTEISDAHFALGYETSVNGSEWKEVMKAVFRRA